MELMLTGPPAELPYNRWYHHLARAILRGIIWLGYQILGRMRVEGRQNVPRTGPVILAPNHISAADWPAVGLSSPRPLVWLAKHTLFEHPATRWFLRLFHVFPVRRGAADRAALRLAEDLLRQGHALVIFPEGRVSPDARLQPLKPGLAFVALRTGVPVVPVALRGTERLLPYGKLIPRFSPRPVVVRFGEPLRFDDLWRPDEGAVPPREAIDAATERLRVALASLLAETQGAGRAEAPPR
ncbi:MAG: 1-acyl-sn-glycerol-3-phosphate acyltransferase [Armatimonadetes bacterium]|nr:1-acyl-sn-glycerol-3-phosphate acyltransferase [Armatimonadota bacterium]